MPLKVRNQGRSGWSEAASPRFASNPFFLDIEPLTCSARVLFFGDQLSSRTISLLPDYSSLTGNLNTITQKGTPVLDVERCWRAGLRPSPTILSYTSTSVPYVDIR